jgi:hypothetical protein
MAGCNIGLQRGILLVISHDFNANSMLIIYPCSVDRQGAQYRRPVNNERP